MSFRVPAEAHLCYTKKKRLTIHLYIQMQNTVAAAPNDRKCHSLNSRLYAEGEKKWENRISP